MHIVPNIRNTVNIKVSNSTTFIQTDVFFDPYTQLDHL